MFYDLLIVFAFPHIGNSRIDHFMDLLHDFTHIEKCTIKLTKKNKCLCNTIGCKAQEGAE